MEPTDLTIRILQEMRDEMRGMRADHAEFRREVNARFEEVNARFEGMNARFEVVETALRDMAQQLVMQSHAIRAALDKNEA